MNPLDFLSNSEFIEKMYLNDQVFIGKVSNQKIFIRVIKQAESADSFKVSWYYNATDNPVSIMDEVPFVDILELVPEKLSETILFNMSIFR